MPTDAPTAVSAEIRPPLLAADDLKRRVKNFFWQSRRPALQRVTIEVDNGIVTLSGRMPSFHTRQLCVSFCRRVAGVIRVVDKMDVVWEESTTP